MNAQEINTDLFSLGQVKAGLIEKGLIANIWHTGGGCATLYVGTPNAEDFYPVVCGPAIYDPSNPDNSEGYLFDFFIGRDDDFQSEGFYYKNEDPNIDEVKNITETIFNYYNEIVGAN